MAKTYDDITAKHYAAYRPSLHAPILAHCLQGRHFDVGMDVGCGTGTSTLALANYCHSVIGIDPSQEMLDKAVHNPKIKYHHTILEESGLASNSFDVITFAGTLFYAKSKRVYDKALDVGKPGSLLVIYDFEVDLGEALKIIGLTANDLEPPAYDHEINFSGMTGEKLLPIEVAKRKTTLSVSPVNLAHLVLSEKTIYHKLTKKLGSASAFHAIKQLFSTRTKGGNYTIEAKTYWSIYENAN